MFRDVTLKDIGNITYQLCDELRKQQDRLDQEQKDKEGRKKVSTLASLHLMVRAWYPEEDSKRYQVEIILQTFGPCPETMYVCCGPSAGIAIETFKEVIGLKGRPNEKAI